jgi:hypothetical protein
MGMVTGKPRFPGAKAAEKRRWEAKPEWEKKMLYYGAYILFVLPFIIVLLIILWIVWIVI